MPEQSGLYFTDQGEGFPVLLIHGLCETHQLWDSFSNELSKDFRVLTIDLPGFGKSNLLPTKFTISDVASKVIGWIKDLQIDSCIVIGHSLGGYVTLAMVEQDPKRFSAFGLFHSTAYEDSVARKISRDKVIEFVSRHGVAPFIESFIPPLFYNRKNPHIARIVELALETKSLTLIAYVEAMRDRPDRSIVLQQFNGAILFISGGEDTGITPDSVKEQSELNPESVLHILTEVAHMGMFENERVALSVVKGFLFNQTRYIG